MFLIWLIENKNHKWSVDVKSKKRLTSNKQLQVFNITKFCAMTPRGRINKMCKMQGW